MAKYKHYDYRQTKMLPISFDRQILPGTFEHTLNELIDEHVDLSVFEDRYDNDESGAPAYDPAILLKIILFAYSKGITSSRQIEELCRENVVCMALSADTTPHFTTIATFVSSLIAEITEIFRNVLLVCDEAGLIGKEMFAVDGVKLPAQRLAGVERHAGGVLEEDPQDGACGGAPAGAASLQRSAGRAGAVAGARAADRDAEPRDRQSPEVSSRTRRQSRSFRASKEEQHHGQRVGQDAFFQGSDPGVRRVGDGRWQAADDHEAQAYGEGQEHGC